MELEKVKEFGKYADLDICSKMNLDGYCPIHWIDYEDDDDHQTFFRDFEIWWSELPFEEQKEIFKKYGNK